MITAGGPIPDSYWLVEGRVLAGEYPGAPTESHARRKLESFLAAGIRSFIDLTEERDGLAPYAALLRELARDRAVDVRDRRIRVRDLGIPTSSVMREILAALGADLQEGRPVYLHCWGGIGRTGTVAGCWLVEGGLAADDALERLKRLRVGTPGGSRPSPETPEQRDFVQRWTPQGGGSGAEGPAGDTEMSRRPSMIGGPPGLARYRGALLGLAAGDALGTTLEFKPPGTFEPISDLVGGGPFRLQPGQWTDDTSMALCLADSLLERRGLDPADQLRRYLRWFREGHHSSTGYCFDIGITVRQALAEFEAHGDPARCGATGPRSAGNGSIMRLAPVPLFFAADPERAIAAAAESSKTTHAHPEAVDGCRFFAGLMVGALQGRSKEELLTPMFSPVPGLWSREPLVPPIAEVASGSYLRREPPQIKGSGYVTRSLEAALWAFSRSRSFEEGALRAVNLGDDADTTGAVYGQLAGAFYGVDTIPVHWRARLVRGNEIEALADALARHAL